MARASVVVDCATVDSTVVAGSEAATEVSVLPPPPQAASKVNIDDTTIDLEGIRIPTSCPIRTSNMVGSR